MYYSEVLYFIRDKQGYLIRIVTGSQPNAGTTAKVNIKLYGKQRDSPPRLLSAQRPLFASKSTESFVLKYPTSLGKLHHIHIWHDNSGRDPSWFLENVTVTDLNTNRTRFIEFFLYRYYCSVLKYLGKYLVLLTHIYQTVLYSYTFSHINTFSSDISHAMNG